MAHQDTKKTCRRSPSPSSSSDKTACLKDGTDDPFAAPPALEAQLKRSGASETHLVAFQHGLWGDSTNLHYLANQLYKAHTGVCVLLIKSNEGSFTYDGVELCGKRCADEVLSATSLIENLGVRVSKFSFLGYSLGGLITRYAAGILWSAGYFKERIMMSYTSFATPHLGATPSTSPVWRTVQETAAVNFLGQTGDDMTFIPPANAQKPILERLADESSVYYKALSGFRKRTLYANVVNDRIVPFYTAYITDEDPFADISAVELEFSPTNPSLVVSHRPTTAAPPPSTNTLTHIASYTGIGLLMLAASPVVAGVLAVSGYRAASSRKRVSALTTATIATEHESVEETQTEDGDTSFPRTTSATGELALEAAEDTLGAMVENPDGLDMDSWSGNRDGALGSHEQPVTTKVPLDEREKLAVSLNKLSWRKYMARMRHRRSHAAIVVRERRWEDDGRDVVMHWVGEFEV
ncbi:DUF676-domain-containing protein [Gonapodya prolifera JEL478]|uniref:DUF676-domain-containing protein n=1 Tax=Gonapodya prolifera (strain JEL478) TaxID=1344416 RepID=A0A138ZZD8_GONPJ|nr:DUF676-domain-containing protein [Gonapodya prolifera JEL478]|eukprot:KXS09635.1 DUF676-domain-containing protein [Gonapodya prolifera JEL478]